MKIKATFPKRRDGGYGSVTIELKGKRVALPIGADGIVDVPDDEQAARLVNLGNFGYADGSKPKVEKPKVEKPKVGEGMTITNGDEVIDLLALDKDALFNLANNVMGLAMHPKCGEAKLRAAIFEHVNG